MVDIHRGDLFSSASATFRLLDTVLVRGKKVAHIIGMDEAKALPKQWPFEEVVDGLKDGTYLKASSNARAVVVRAKDDQADPKQLAAAKSPAEILLDWRWNLIKPLVSNPDIYLRKKRGPLVAGRAEEMGASEQTIMTCLRLYWRGGMTKDALLGSFDKCGTAKNPLPLAEQTPRGRLPRRERYEKYRWKSEAEKKKVLRIARKFLRAKKTNTRHFVYRRVIATLYSVRDANGKPVPFPLGERPTRAQVLYLLEKDRSIEEILRRKLGDDVFENDVQPKVGSAREYANGIGQYYEIDSTIVDTWICAEEDPTVVIGKATLYLIIDTFSRLIVGFHLTLEPPSWDSALEAIMTIVEDKQQLCERLGLEYRAEDWVAHGFWPQLFRADRGPEMIGYDSDCIPDGLETGIVNVPRRKAPRKGTVEVSFKLVHAPIRGHVGGHTPSAEQRKRQVDNHKGEATRTLRSLLPEIFSGIQQNNHKVMTRIKLPAAQVYERELAIPTRMWERDREQRAGMLTQLREEDLRFKLLPSDWFTVTPVGVFYKGLLWVPERSKQAKWLLPATRGFYKVRATFRRNLVDFIYVHDQKDPTAWTKMYLADDCIDSAGKTFAEVEDVEEARLTLAELAAEHNLALEIAHDEASAAREKAARAKTQAALDKAGSRSRTTGAVAMRDDEARRNRLKQKALPATVGAPPAANRTPQISSAAPARPALLPSVTGSTPGRAGNSNSMAAGNQGLQALLDLRKRTA
ncbi:hypothetical protein [Roseateles noduli]|uniref:hypothetical protein n=1 Tax=Roseateles noduli TaxID=2052484 RepID=UPI003D65FDB9